MRRAVNPRRAPVPVHARRGLVEEEDGGAEQELGGDAESLPLPAREPLGVGAPNQRVPALTQAHLGDDLGVWVFECGCVATVGW
jgi:hypothetical protein